MNPMVWGCFIFLGALFFLLGPEPRHSEGRGLKSHFLCHTPHIPQAFGSIPVPPGCPIAALKAVWNVALWISVPGCTHHHKWHFQTWFFLFVLKSSRLSSALLLLQTSFSFVSSHYQTSFQSRACIFSVFLSPSTISKKSDSVWGNVFVQINIIYILYKNI